MGWGRMLLLGNIGQQMDLDDHEADLASLKRRLERSTLKLGQAGEELERLRAENDELKLYLAAVFRILLAKNIVSYTGVSRGINYGSNKVRFTNMVPVGSRVRMRTKMLSCEPRGGALQITNQFTIEVEGEERPACVARPPDNAASRRSSVPVDHESDR